MKALGSPPALSAARSLRAGQESLSPDARKLKGIRLMLDCVDGKAMMLTGEPDGMGLSIERASGRLVPVAKFLPAASATDMEMVAGALENVLFLTRLLARAAVKIRVLEEDLASAERSIPDREKLKGEADKTSGTNFAAEAAIKCTEPAFKRFLMDCHGLESPASDAATAAKLRQMLGIKSRSEINSDEAVAARWKALRGAFATWRRM